MYHIFLMMCLDALWAKQSMHPYGKLSGIQIPLSFQPLDSQIALVHLDPKAIALPSSDITVCVFHFVNFLVSHLYI